MVRRAGIRICSPRVPVTVSNRPRPTDPAKTIEIFHLHCHFESSSESVALAFLESTRIAVGKAGERVVHDHVWHEKNGPHDSWSWEIWVETARALGAAAAHFMQFRPQGTYLLMHCDTDQEYTDHSCRLAWVGPTDPLPLDLHFFKPLPTYEGPIDGRRTDVRAVFSMGEFWPRGPDGAVQKDAYGAVARQHSAPAARLPALFLPHGAPPIPIEPCKSSGWLATAAATLPCKPKGIVFMSPHHFERTFTVSTNQRPATMMDFDSDTSPAALAQLRKLQYPCPGDPALGQRVAALLNSAGIPCLEDSTRDLDHGIWTPLFVMFPHADIPVCSLSVRRDLDTMAHINVGRALAPLANEGILLLGSGEVVHNVPMMGARDSKTADWCLSFESWLESAMQRPPGAARDALLASWKANAPDAAIAHPADSPGEHLMPWFFAYGAAGDASIGRCAPRCVCVHARGLACARRLLSAMRACHQTGEGAHVFCLHTTVRSEPFAPDFDALRAVPYRIAEPHSIHRCVFKEYLGSLPMAAYEFARTEISQSKL
jgi:aromatic ring-opening dioxygenase catalytic subunit (LigB family)/aromatic ring-cleaving dioxygenase